VGRRHGDHPDLQLCAQALCLEEMLGVAVPRGAIYYHALRRRHEVVLDSPLRARTLEAVAAIRAMLASQELPPAPNDARCPKCSLLDVCLPNVVGEPARLRGFQGVLFQVFDASEPDDA
jgi:CRISPR-associated exonuclease Cas4